MRRILLYTTTSRFMVIRNISQTTVSCYERNEPYQFGIAQDKILSYTVVFPTTDVKVKLGEIFSPIYMLFCQYL